MRASFLGEPPAARHCRNIPPVGRRRGPALAADWRTPGTGTPAFCTRQVLLRVVLAAPGDLVGNRCRQRPTGGFARTRGGRSLGDGRLVDPGRLDFGGFGLAGIDFAGVDLAGVRYGGGRWCGGLCRGRVLFSPRGGQDFGRAQLCLGCRSSGRRCLGRGRFCCGRRGWRRGYGGGRRSLRRCRGRGGAFPARNAAKISAVEALPAGFAAAGFATAGFALPGRPLWPRGPFL